MKKYILTIAFVLFFVIGMVLSYTIFKPAPKQMVTSQSILTALTSEGFLVSQNYVFQQTVTIEKSTGSALKDVFFGQTIEATALMKVSAGVALSKLQEQDIRVTGTEIHIALPPVETQSIEILGNITLDNSQGIVKRLVDNDDGYNVALSELKQQAKSAAETPELQQEALVQAQKQIQTFLQFVDPEKKVLFK